MQQDIKKTAFACPEGQLKCVWMPFGLKNAGAMLQWALNLMMGLSWEEVLVYLNDLIMFSPTWNIPPNAGGSEPSAEAK